MRVFISVDIEGITGLVSWSQCSRPDGNSYDYPFARRMMTHDVNAAIRGAREAGATELVVKDSHGNSKNLLVADLDGPVTLISGQGSGHDGMMEGIADGFDAAVLVGYHAMAGAQGGVMEHTITGGIHHLRINGQRMGEIGLAAAAAGQYGVPLVAVCSDAAGCAEAANLVPSLSTFVTKTGRGRYMADCLHPATTGPGIQAAVREGLLNPPAPFVLAGEVELSVEFNRAEEADMVARYRSFRRLDGYTVGNSFATFADAHNAVWEAVQLSFCGINSQY
ncbi:MAG: M55 family metallopeptidase [Fimbriimonadaceae bacterium]|nr:M55 family metallopeptidase [Fimbriimonadaceae bacterium]